MNQNGITCALVFLIALAGCSSSEKKDTTRADGYNDYEQQDQQQPKEGKTHTVEIKQMKFIPEKLVVQKGDKIVWINNDFVDHDVTEQKNKTWTSSTLHPNESWSMVVTKNDIYYCSIHVVMTGNIVVDEQSAADGKEALLTGETSGITMCR